ncbi:MAG TPA: FAD-dependent thymidylate synthase [Oscillospiraceae bacterium]|nr:FAD-dependent thymidylate synthase [Oscillospiraceae bacterium]HPF55203.1 FAD-dependent thymidylate synthase [Clostridiales bacterium]HPK36413.1 FAD-dependent thymidylate synthase [Oscillospiraceae bacterium]HPR75717.1 FAD-dependent thymidylate synthase [Oscillospiraceae bacterium]
MKVIAPGFEFVQKPDGEQILHNLEYIGRVCYKSEDKITADSAAKFVGILIKNGHESVIEHEKITVKITCDRGISHEIVRHRLASYSQESTRYCNYNKEKFGGELTFIRPFFWNEDPQKYALWEQTMARIENAYIQLIGTGATPDEARTVLPNSLKTELVMTMNLREWRHFFVLRTSPKAHPQMRELTIPMLKAFQVAVPVIFDDILVSD